MSGAYSGLCLWARSLMSNARAETRTQDPLPVEQEVSMQVGGSAQGEGPTRDPGPKHQTVRCRVCGETIGVYEPLIALLHGQPLETSRAAREGVGAHEEECFHRACYTLTAPGSV
jgi:hypothetical protein